MNTKRINDLKARVCELNLMLPRQGLVTLTWGNVSEFDAEIGLVAIKPSGVEYDRLLPEHIVILDLSGKVQGGSMKPSSDTATHLEIYRNFPGICGVCHTHSRHATVFAQRRAGIKAFGTTHADYFYGEVPCARVMTDDEIAVDYELNTGRVIVETFNTVVPGTADLPAYQAVKAVLAANHGPFTWGKDGLDAVHGSIVLEECAYMALLCENCDPCQQALLDKHYLRKHGKGAYYGQ